MDERQGANPSCRLGFVAETDTSAELIAGADILHDRAVRGVAQHTAIANQGADHPVVGEALTR